MRKERLIGGALFVGLTALVAIGVWQTRVQRSRTRIAVVHRPRAVMGTNCSLAGVVLARDRGRAEEAIHEAEQVLRAIEARMSRWLTDSEISQLNAAPAGRHVPLSPQTLEVLRAAREATAETGGAFDVTCGPLVELWQNAGQRGVLPQESELADARAASLWELFEINDAGASKSASEARVDLGGITKGYAIDRALEVLREAGLDGGLVDLGGDLACFGSQATAGQWPVDVQDPFSPRSLLRLRIAGGAVATSGNYARYAEIEGERYSHIIDPRSGWPTQMAAGVTVIAPDALTADVWATALGVLGPEGFPTLPNGVDALLITGSPEDYQILSTPGCRALMIEPVPEEIRVWQEGSR